jgi:soluble lytic murein transglycosylase-like protein
MTQHRTAALMILASVLWCASAAFAGDGIATATADDGRKIFVNQSDIPHPNTSSRQSPTDASGHPVRYVYWSNTEHRWKPIPAKSIIAQRARSAAAEVLAQTGAAEASDKAESATTFVSSEKVNEAIEVAAARHNVDPELVRAVIKVESNFNSRAVSRKGAMGLMQLMPDTARNLNVSHPFDPNENVEAGVRHLRKLLDDFGGDLGRSLAAYNAGEKAVQQHNGIPPYRETQQYVRQITSLYRGGNIGTPWRAPIRVSRDSEGHLLFSNTE